MANWPKPHIWNYHTQPSHIFDILIWPILRPLMLWLAHGKISHWWHWIKIKISPKWKNIVVKGDPKHSFSYKTGLVYNPSKGPIGLDQM